MARQGVGGEGSRLASKVAPRSLLQPTSRPASFSSLRILRRSISRLATPLRNSRPSSMSSLFRYARSFFTSAPVSQEQKQVAKDTVEVSTLCSSLPVFAQ